MNKIRWDDSLSIGIELIDEQHKKWLEHLDNVSTAIESQQGLGQIAKTLGFLDDYTRFHFSTEEKHMTENDYPGLKGHRAKHEELKGTLANLIQDFEEEGATHTLADSINTFLGNWLVNHIQQVDQQFGAFVKEKGIVLTEQP
jgi:hemerythrin